MSGISKTIYLCNPDLNTKCSKTGCGYIREDGPCFRTCNPEFAVVDDAGQPVEATEEDVEMVKQVRSAPVQNWNVPGGIGYGIHLSSGVKKGGCNGDYCEL